MCFKFCREGIYFVDLPFLLILSFELDFSVKDSRTCVLPPPSGLCIQVHGLLQCVYTQLLQGG